MCVRSARGVDVRRGFLHRLLTVLVTGHQSGQGRDVSTSSGPTAQQPVDSQHEKARRVAANTVAAEACFAAYWGDLPA